VSRFVYYFLVLLQTYPHTLSLSLALGCCRHSCSFLWSGNEFSRAQKFARRCRHGLSPVSRFFSVLYLLHLVYYPVFVFAEALASAAGWMVHPGKGMGGLSLSLFVCLVPSFILTSSMHTCLSSPNGTVKGTISIKKL
jgi:hypothetical protein